MRGGKATPARIKVGMKHTLDAGQIQTAIFGVRMISMNKDGQEGQSAYDERTGSLCLQRRGWLFPLNRAKRRCRSCQGRNFLLICAWIRRRASSAQGFIRAA